MEVWHVSVFIFATTTVIMMRHVKQFLFLLEYAELDQISEHDRQEFLGFPDKHKCVTELIRAVRHR